MSNIDQIHTKLDQLYALYEDNPYLLSKIENYVLVQLPKYIQTSKEKKEAQTERKKEMMEIQDKFSRNFMNNNPYFYINSTEIFIKYDNSNYGTAREDDINHKILTSISYKGGNLMQWKYKIKAGIIKNIKGKSLYDTIPDSITIQNTIDMLYPTLFKSKEEAKYFLTIIGDAIKKNTDTDKLVYIVSIKTKKFLRDIGQLIYFYTNVNVFNQFKFKYHDQNYSDIRLLNFNTSVKYIKLWESLKYYILNIVAISCFYSTRYESSDKYLLNECDTKTVNYITYIKNNTNDAIIERFLSEYIEKSPNTLYTVTWKNMYFLWKTYLEDNELPNMIFAATLKQKLLDKFDYNEQTDTFIGLTSRYLPFVSKFIEFFTTHFYENTDEIEFEIDEISMLFKEYIKNKKIFFNDKKILNVLMHYWDSIHINDDKYIYGWSTKLWNKAADIDNALEIIKDNYKHISVCDCYVEYTKLQKNIDNHIISKTYFEKYINETYTDNITDNELSF